MMFREIRMKKCYQIIDKTKASGTCKFNAISPQIMKIIPHASCLFLTHGINAILRTKKFLEILKLSRIIPTSKKNKNKLLHKGYRPISLLHIYEMMIHTASGIAKYMTEDMRIILGGGIYLKK